SERLQRFSWYPRLKGEMGLLLHGVTRIDGSRKVHVEPLFTPEAYLELVEEAKEVSAYIDCASQLGAMKGHEIPTLSFLFDRILAEVDHAITLSNSSHGGAKVHWIADIPEFKVLEEKQFELRVIVDRFGGGGSNLQYTGTAVERHLLEAELDRFGRLRVNWKESIALKKVLL
ncbi:MAG: hypothetical protein KDD53_11810, partial [Bdellovibrionales bacterium]|nr:hypothetical protein [Bdellovibrionales bacterium]